MKTLLILITSILLFSCTPSGTTQQVDTSPNDNIHIIKYFYADGEYVYIARFMDQPEVVSTNWTKTHHNGKTTTTENKVCISNNTINPRSYQIQLIENDYILLYDKDKLIGRFKSSNSLDSLITKDNQ
jgi:hypothetical protein